MTKYEENTNKEFYPTPKSLIRKMLDGIDFWMVNTILEPSAGKGDLCDAVKEAMDASYHRYDRHKFDLDCIELDPNLRKILEGKEYRVVHDDFLTYHTWKHYDLIIMNPPFSNGAAHLRKALDMQKRGGGIVCLLNAETIRNPYTNERKALIQTLNEYNAEISYLKDEFIAAENRSNVEVALVRVLIPKEEKSDIYGELRKKYMVETATEMVTDVAPTDYVRAIISQYNLEAELGAKIISEFEGLKPYILEHVGEKKYNEPILELKMNHKGDANVNDYIRALRRKYWTALFGDSRFMEGLTSRSVSEWHERVAELVDYDFSFYNICTIQEKMAKARSQGIEDSIIEIFEELSAKHSWYPESAKNIHYYNGWATNKAYMINHKVIIPLDGYSSWSEKPDYNRRALAKLNDIETALDYLNGSVHNSERLYNQLQIAERNGDTKKIQTRYFHVSFYKKGTCHIVFTDEAVWKKLNIYGSQKKGWLPKTYGKKAYQDMEAVEKAVVDSFEGEKSYNEVFARADYFLVTDTSLPKICA